MKYIILEKEGLYSIRFKTRYSLFWSPLWKSPVARRNKLQPDWNSRHKTIKLAEECIKEDIRLREEFKRRPPKASWTIVSRYP